MFGIENYVLFLLSGIILNITPGSDTMYILGRSISQGSKAGIMSAMGISSGSIIHTLLASFGLSVILAKSIIAFNILKYVGAAYLIYLGIKAILSSSDTFILNEAKINNMSTIYFQGMLTNLLNPKVALFFIAFLPQFVSANNNYGSLPFLLLGITFITTGTIWCIMLAICSASATEKLRDNKKLLTLMKRCAGIIFIGLGLKLFSTKVAH
ncbi:MAG TPA: LysE family translocator [Desulfotomaculum sp.]|nr:MAG: homoserine lactone transporter [Desulfotomaculum sp. BICA1-6]KUO64587.1 MAG: homoserine lactone transporter [Gracilibacter sp. BRH_c7a]HBX23658.1 LysE family translocator [Desulfotomaculum sp.]